MGLSHSCLAIQENFREHFYNSQHVLAILIFIFFAFLLVSLKLTFFSKGIKKKNQHAGTISSTSDMLHKHTHTYIKSLNQKQKQNWLELKKIIIIIKNNNNNKKKLQIEVISISKKKKNGMVS